MIEPRTLVELQNRPTTYEVVLRANGYEKRLGFTARRTKAVLLGFAREHSELILTRMFDPDATARYSKAYGWQFGNVYVRFSGRTERDIASELTRA